MSIGRDFIFDTLKYIPIKIMPAFSGILTVFFLTKKGLLDTQYYLDYTFIIATLLIFMQIVGGWVNSSVIYYYTGFTNNNDKESFRLNISFIQLFFLGIGTICIFLIIFFTLDSAVLAFLITIILILQTFLNFNYSFLQAKRKIKDQVSATFIQSSFQIFGLIICYFFFRGSILYLFFFLLLSYLITTIYIVLSRKNYLHITIIHSFEISYCKKILSYGFPICLWFFSTQIYQIGDRILFKYFNVTSNVGNYVSFRDVAVGLSGFVAMPLLFASQPIIMQLSKNSKNKVDIEKVIRRNIYILCAIFFPLIISTYFYGEFVIKYLVSEKYLLESSLMTVILLTILLGIVSIYLQKGIEVNGKTFLMLKVSIIVAVISVLLNVILIRKYGIVSSIYISLLSHILYCVIIYFYSRKVFKIFF